MSQILNIEEDHKIMKIQIDHNHELHLMSHSFKISSKYLMTISMNARRLSSFQKNHLCIFLLYVKQVLFIFVL